MKSKKTRRTAKICLFIELKGGGFEKKSQGLFHGFELLVYFVDFCFIGQAQVGVGGGVFVLLVFAHSLVRWLACSGRNLLGPGLKGFVQSKLWTRSWLPGEMMRVSTRTFLLCFIGVDLVPNAD